MFYIRAHFSSCLPQFLYQQAWQDSNLQRMVLETIALPIGATGLYPRQRTSWPNLFLCFFMNNAFTARRAEFLQFNPFWLLAFVFGTVVINAIALSALKMNCLAHNLSELLLRSPACINGVTEDCCIFKPPSGIEPLTSSLPRTCSTN